MTIEDAKKYPFMIHAEDGILIMGLPSGFAITTRQINMFIDGSTHEIKYDTTATYDQFMAMPPFDPDWFQKAYPNAKRHESGHTVDSAADGSVWCAECNRFIVLPKKTI